MLCKIAELITEVPETGGMAFRCQEYLWETDKTPDILIREDRYRPENYPMIPEHLIAYMDSGFQFNGNLLRHNGMMLHASAVTYDGRAYLFSGPCGMGKSTHTRLWQSVFGENARVINDDKPALRCMDGRWYAYGTPWCGKDGINRNEKAPLAGICFLKQAPHNRIRRLCGMEATQKLMAQTIHRFEQAQMLDLMLERLDLLVKNIPVYELENRPEPDAVQLSYETMRRGAEEIGL